MKIYNRKGMQVVFVLSEASRGYYCRMTTISATSVRISNPNLSLILVADRQTAKNIKNEHNPVLEAFDQCIEVDVPNGTRAWQSRFLKTCVGFTVDGSFLFLDSDILVRKNLSKLFSVSADIAAAPNNSQSNRQDQEWIGDTTIGEAMGWKFSSSEYLNSGVVYFAGNPASVMFARKWHEHWLASSFKTRDHRDQPAFNSVWAAACCHTAVLNDCFNAQIMYGPGAVTFDASVWHFYLSAHDLEPTIFSDLLQQIEGRDSVSVSAIVSSAIKRRVPWTESSTPRRIEDTLWDAYRCSGIPNLNELLLLLKCRKNWRNILMTICCLLGAKYEWCRGLIDITRSLRPRIR